MKTFGSHSSLGAQIAVNFTESAYPWLYGRMDIFLGGMEISTDQDDVLLSDVLSLSDTWFDKKDKRRNENLENADTRTAFLSLETALYGNDYISWPMKNELILPVQNPLDYEICFAAASDHVKVYAIELDHTIRILCSKNNELPFETLMPTQDFYFILYSIKMYLQEELQKILQ